MIRAADILKTLLHWAPASLAWDKDNIGLLVGSSEKSVRRILVCLDVTEAVVDEAVERQVDLIVAHHPVIFRPMYSIRTDTFQGRILEKLLRGGIAVIAMHTNADAAPDGLNKALAERLGLTALRVLDPAEGQRRRIELRLAEGRTAVSLAADAFADLPVTNWHAHELGGGGGLLALDTTVTDLRNLLAALRERLGEAILSHRTFTLEDKLETGGIGMVGEVEGGIDVEEFLVRVKDKLGCPMLRCTPFEAGMRINCVAVCGGAGTSYIRSAIAAGAQCMVTGDLTHHTFLDFGGDILLVDAGHYETENVFVDLCLRMLTNASFQDREKIDILPVRTNTNPVRFV